MVQRLYERGVRFSNAELPFFDFLRNTGPLKEVLKPVFKSIASVAVGAKIDMELELKWEEDEKDGEPMPCVPPLVPRVGGQRLARACVSHRPTGASELALLVWSTLLLLGRLAAARALAAAAAY